MLKFYNKPSKGYLREQLPQIDLGYLPKLIQVLKKHLNISFCYIQIKDITPAQKEISNKKIQDKINNKSQQWLDRYYIIDKNNCLLDGHHDYAYGLECDEEQLVKCIKVDCTIDKLIKICNQLNFTYSKSINESKKYFQTIFKEKVLMKKITKAKALLEDGTYVMLDARLLNESFLPLKKSLLEKHLRYRGFDSPIKKLYEAKTIIKEAAYLDYANKPRPSRMSRIKPEKGKPFYRSSADKPICYGHCQQLLIDKYGAARGEKTYEDVFVNSTKNFGWTICQQIQYEKLGMIAALGFERPANLDTIPYYLLWVKWTALIAGGQSSLPSGKGVININSLKNLDIKKEVEKLKKTTK